MGVINVSPESFYKGSIRTTDQEIAAAAREMQQGGAHIIDVGAMSTAPYLETIIPIEEEETVSSCERADQGRLADAGLAGDEGDAARPGRREVHLAEHGQGVRALPQHHR